MVPEPVTTVYERPLEKVLFNEERDANPFLHLFEGLWMLAGRNDVKFVSQLVKKMAEFSDDGETFHGAYGYRWRKYFQTFDGDQGVTIVDQLRDIAEILSRYPDDRRCMLQMWDPGSDLNKKGKDFPCNTSVNFQRDSNGKLNIVVFNRSNDIIWGCYGSDVVHFSMLLEFMAAWIGCPVGTYTQVSCNWHGYTANAEQYFTLDLSNHKHTYQDEFIAPHPMVNVPIDQWQRELSIFLDEGVVMGIKDPFFRRVAGPMLRAHRAFKELDAPQKYKVALKELDTMAVCDWKLATFQWLRRRWSAWMAKNN